MANTYMGVDIVCALEKAFGITKSSSKDLYMDMDRDPRFFALWDQQKTGTWINNLLYLSLHSVGIK